MNETQERIAAGFPALPETLADRRDAIGAAADNLTGDAADVMSSAAGVLQELTRLFDDGRESLARLVHEWREYGRMFVVEFHNRVAPLRRSPPIRVVYVGHGEPVSSEMVREAADRAARIAV